jgi:hypothetical protein
MGEDDASDKRWKVSTEPAAEPVSTLMGEDDASNKRCKVTEVEAAAESASTLSVSGLRNEVIRL